MRKVVVGSVLLIGALFAACSGGEDANSVFLPNEPIDDPGLVEPAPPAPFGGTDAAPPPVVDAAIDCDADPAACLPPSVCGDGKPGLGESCDDANTTDGDGCSSACQIEAPYWACAFGSLCVDVRDCDALGDAGVAIPDGGCVVPPKPIVCGDGMIDPGEACDDGNTFPGDGCSLDCKTIEAHFECPTPGALCVSTMTCGDGKVTGTEQCDDGDLAPGDGCSATCKLEVGWSCPVPGTACIAAACGDGKLAGNEECDDGNKIDGDGCSATCKLQTTTTTVAPTTTSPGSTTIVNWACPVPGQPCVKAVCGNKIREGTEQCDDGNKQSLDGCSADCQWEPSCPDGACVARCGDGLLFDFDANGDGKADEECDDGNTRSGDGCDATCRREPGYVCTTLVEADPPYLDVPVVLRDFKFYAAGDNTSHPDFERYQCNVVTPNLTRSTLVSGVPAFRYDGTGNDPVTGTDMNGTCRSDVGADRSKQLTGAADFSDWYKDIVVPGAGGLRSRRFDDTMIRLTREGAPGDYSYVFDSAKDEPYKTRTGFYPLDGRGWGNQGGWTHNYAFTTELRFGFTYDSTKAPELIFSGDDDVWVFVNGRLALDVGGLHGIQQRSFVLDGTKAAELGLVDKHVYEIALFHAERHSYYSNFRLTLRGFVKKKSVCTSDCGDGIKTPDEQCDHGSKNTNAGSHGSCRLDCKLGPFCGDNVITAPPEECDDGANVSSWMPTSTSTKCAPLCKKPAYCGDGILQGTFGEQCDLGTAKNTGGYGGCRSDCQPGPRCGDGVPQAAFGEECDNGYNVTAYVRHPSSTDCAPQCKKPRYCGDGVVDFPFEQCDRGAQNTDSGAYDSCKLDCTLGPRCGDGIVQIGEQCDDGNRVNGDGCSAACIREGGPVN